MALKFQYNKTELLRLQKDLKVRVNALPTLKNKESALRAIIKKYKKNLKEMEENCSQRDQQYNKQKSLFCEYKDLLTIKNVNIAMKKIAGVKTPVYEGIDFEILPFSIFNEPSWFYDGIEIIKEIATLQIKIKIQKASVEILEWARRKTTQKVNLYEKVQIPSFQDAIVKIKRFIEDQENLDRASQKIVKKKKVQKASKNENEVAA